MRQLLEALFYGLKKSAPQCAVDSSSSHMVVSAFALTTQAIGASAIVTGLVRSDHEKCHCLTSYRIHFRHHSNPI